MAEQLKINVEDITTYNRCLQGLVEDLVRAVANVAEYTANQADEPNGIYLLTYLHAAASNCNDIKDRLTMLAKVWVDQQRLMGNDNVSFALGKAIEAAAAHNEVGN